MRNFGDFLKNLTTHNEHIQHNYVDDTLFDVDDDQNTQNEKNTKNEKSNENALSKKKNQYTFESAIAELEFITKKLESGDMTLEDALELYKKGVELKKICEKELEKAKKLMEKIYEDSLES